MSLLDSGQIIKAVYDEALNRIRVDAQVTANFSGAQEVLIDSAQDSVQVKGPTGNALAPNVDGSLPVTIATAALPTGAATSAKQDTGNTSLSSIDGKVATSANQSTANTSLSSIDSKTNLQEAVIIDDASTTVSYFGKATAGTATSSASWKISRLTVTGSVSQIQWANGTTTYNNIWNSRASLTYA